MAIIYSHVIVGGLFEQWGRLVWWASQGQNAAVVQAITAVVTVFIAIVSIFIGIGSIAVTNRTLKAMQAQVDVANSQFELTQKQFQVSCLPALNATTAFSRKKLGSVMYKYSNIGQSPIRIRDFLIRVQTDARTFTERVEEPVGRVLAPQPPNTQEIEGRFDLPLNVWSEGLSQLKPEDADLRLSWHMTVDDVAGILSCLCGFDPVNGYRVHILTEEERSKHRPENLKF